ncbi:MAG: F0F1 ATP synthase subunit delta [Candidatus Staskawiczbacteria bacterium]|nr:F0F1 ATP synthase subunit delta [Candidatus Staskawiczbacteria bacterium]
MNYTPKIYAKAFFEAAFSLKNGVDTDKLVKNLLIQVKLNRDQRKLKDILFAFEKMEIKKKGGRKLTIETARPLSSRNEKMVESLAKDNDIIERKINSRLVAGIKININDELLLDESFAAKIKKILNI